MLIIHGGYFYNPAQSAAINSVLPIYVLSLITPQGESYNKFRTPFGTESLLCFQLNLVGSPITSARITGRFLFTGTPLKKLKYGKPRSGESTWT